MTPKPPLRPPAMPPVPRDHADASFSELVPFRSTRIKLARSPLLILAVASAVLVPFMFALLGPVMEGRDARQAVSAVIAMNVVVVFLLTMLFQVTVFFYARTDRSFWAFCVPYVVTGAMLAFPILGWPYFFVFRQLLPGQIEPGVQYSFPVQFFKMFFAAGLCEESMKATVPLVGLWLTLRARRQPEAAGGQLYRLIHVRGPLDGLLMGVFAGGGFIMMETAFEYVPRIVNQIAQQTQDVGIAMASGLMLLLPRVLGGLTGHMAYAGIFGYFIGLAAVRPRQMWKLLGIGYVTAATIHALWNSVSVISPLLSYGVTIFAAVMLVGAILKARQLEAGDAGRAAESFGSIVVDRPTAPPATPRPAAAPPAPMPMPAATPAWQPPAAAAAAEQALVLDVEGLHIPVRSGGRLDLAAEPALAGRGAGVAGAIVAHPTRAGVLGLRNVGARPWTATLRDGTRQTIATEQNLRLAAGVAIDFGGIAGRVVPAGR
jgi:RsiW-degrading membrane proteinase PrsW (M82 family)